MKRTLVGVLVMALLIGTGFAPITNVQASAETATADTSSAYVDFAIATAKEQGATVYASSAYDTSCHFSITKREFMLCTDAYDMTTITSRYPTVLAFKGNPSCYIRPIVGYTSDGTAEILYDIDGYNALRYDKNGYDVWGYDYKGYNSDGYDRGGYDKDGYDKNGYDQDGNDKSGYNQNGYNKDGYDKYGYDEIGYDKDGYNKDGYDVYGYNKDGYNKDGYDENGYNKDGYNRNGRDHFGNKRNTFVVDKIIAKRDIDGKLDICVLNVNGEQLGSNYYTVTTKAISMRKGCGTYKVTVKLHAEYGRDKMATDTITETFTVVPDICNIQLYTGASGYAHGSEFYDGKAECRVGFTCSKSALKKFDGVQYVIGKDKNFKNIYAKATVKMKTTGLCKTFNMKDGQHYYLKYRIYTVVNDKKIYSEWEYYSEKVEL